MDLWQTFLDFRFILWDGIIETFYMTFVSVSLAYVLGLPLGVLLVVTGADNLMPNKIINSGLGMMVNTLRSIPYIILIIILIPLSRAIVGTMIGPSAAIVSLVIAAAPFVSRLVETSINEIDQGVIDAAKSMGATNFQIISKVIIPESVPSLIRGFAITTITLISFSAMAGAIGAGGLGHIAIRYGHQRNMTDVMIVTIIIIVIIVAIIQFLFNTLAAKIDKKLVQ